MCMAQESEEISVTFGWKTREVHIWGKNSKGAILDSVSSQERLGSVNRKGDTLIRSFLFLELPIPYIIHS